MTLLELLVKELPMHGGWPEGATIAYQSLYDGEVCFFPKNHDRMIKQKGNLRYFQESDTRGSTNIITREQYEAELAASQQPAWSGEGLPPVGVECETRWKFAISSEWVLFRCVAIDCNVAFGWTGKDAVTLDKESYQFRPIGSEAERKREEVIDALYKSNGFRARDGGKQVAVDIYDAIAAGKIPGIRLTDE